MRKIILFTALMALSGAACAQNIILQEDFEGYDSVDGIDALPTAGFKQDLTTEIVVDNGGVYDPIIGLPNNARFSAPNNFGGDYIIANGVDWHGTAVSGLTNTTSIGLKNFAALTYHMGTGSGLGVVTASVDVATSSQGVNANAGQFTSLEIIAGFNGSGEVLGSTNFFGVFTNTTLTVAGIDTSGYSSTNIYMVIRKNSYGPSHQIDNVLVTASNPPAGVDNDPPMPDPAVLASATAPTFDSAQLVAESAWDDNDIVYNFLCTSGGGTDSGWQFSPSYLDVGLTENTMYTYVVLAKDLSAAENTTATSTPAVVTTPVANLILFEDFEGYDSISGITNLPTPGTKLDLKDEIVLENGVVFDPLLGLPNNARYSAPNNFAGDFCLANGVDFLELPVAGLTNTVSLGLKNYAILTYHLGTGASLGGVTASIDVGTSAHSSNANSGQTLAVSIIAGFDGDGTTLASKSIYGVSTNTTLVLSGVDTSAYSTNNIYLRIQKNSYGASHQVDNILVSATLAPGVDTTPPDPDPAVLSGIVLSPYEVELTAQPALDESDVAYKFICTDGGGNDSDWQYGSVYTDSGLSPNTVYTYVLLAKDLSVAENTTATSTPVVLKTDYIYVKPVSADHLIEDFETYDDFLGITLLPGTQQNVSSLLASNNAAVPQARWVSIAGVPNDALYSGANAFENSYFSYGQTQQGQDLAGVFTNYSMGLKNHGCLTYNLGSNLGDLTVEFDLGVGNNANQGLDYFVCYSAPYYVNESAADAEFTSDNKIIDERWQGDDGSAQLIRHIGIDTSVAGTNDVYLVFQRRGWGDTIHLDNIQAYTPLTVFANWIAEYRTLSAGEQAEDADPDGDGYDNLHEYGFDGNPTNGADIGIIPMFVRSGASEFEYHYPARVEDLSLEYHVMTADDLVVGSWGSLGGGVGTGSMTNSLEWHVKTLPATDPEAFYVMDLVYP